MKRPLFLVGPVYALTSWAAFLLGFAEALQFSAAAAATGVLLWLLRKRLRQGLAFSVALFTVAAALGGYGLFLARAVLPLQRLAGTEVVVEGLVTEVETFANSANFTMRASLPEVADAPRDFMLVLRSFGELEQKPGDVVRCRATLAVPDQRVSYYTARGVFVTGTKVHDAQRLEGGFAFTRRVMKLREMLRANLYATLSSRTADIVAAMVLGFDGNIPSEIYAALNRAGTSHLLTVSGLHLSVLAAFLLAALKKIRCPDRIAALFTIAGLFLFSALVGFGAPIFRSFVMAAMMLLARAISSRSDSRSSLGLALLLACAARPFWMLSPGLWLSACSTLGIITFSGKWQKWVDDRWLTGGRARGFVVKTFGGALVIGAAAYVFALPVLLVVAGYVSLLAPAANVFIAPFVPVAVVGGVFCALAGSGGAIAEVVAFLTDFCTAVIVRISELFSSLKFAVFGLGESYLLIWMILVIFAVVLSRKRDQNFRLAAALLCVLSFSLGNVSLQMARQNKAELVTINFSNCAAIIRGGEAVLVGTPTRAEAERWVRYLTFRGVDYLPAVAAMDCPNNPGTGLARLNGEFGIGCIVGPNDAYILEQLSGMLPGLPVYSGGYAVLEALGGVEAATRLPGKDIFLSAGGAKIVKTRRDCDIIQPYTGGEIFVFADGVVVLPPSARPAFEPVAALIFGEKRVYLHL